jgi:hypothetical protein
MQHEAALHPVAAQYVVRKVYRALPRTATTTTPSTDTLRG